MHQPLHAGDDHVRGGNLKIAAAPSISPDTLHHDWDTEFAARLGSDAAAIAGQLIADMTDVQRAQWAAGSAADWARESFEAAKYHAYGLLPAADGPNHYTLSAAYIADATKVSREQLSKAGVRLAFVLNRAMR